MTHKDHRIIFTALGFLAVIMRDDIAQDKQALRATGIAKLIESFCMTAIPDAFGDEYPAYSTSSPDIERLVADYITELRTMGSAALSFDRLTLLKMYELLVIQKMRHDQEAFYAIAQDDIIANSILRLAEKQIGWEEE